MDVDCLHGHAQGWGRRRRLLQRDEAHIGLSYTRWLPRFLDLLEAQRAPCTFFLVADFARHPICRPTLRRLLDAGHEVACHSLTHPLELRHLSRARQWRELHDSRKLLQDLTGQPVYGFRGPGYAMDAALAEMLLQAGYRYDSSVMPGRLFPAYKWAAHLADRALGVAPTAFPAGVRRAAGGVFTLARNAAEETLTELPLNVTPRLGAPWVSFIIRQPARMTRTLHAIAARERTLIYQFHDFELMEHADPTEARLTRATQRDRKHPLSARLALFAQVIAALRAQATLATAATVAHCWSPTPAAAPLRPPAPLCHQETAS
ncbi:putative polysaccharide deacetylase [Magnetofaba australis IT-1]|uniref:Putative polysaccharide deacetylase n=2 Tax=Magnetofaba TaxID=1472292 RepID=A0A1Y2K4F7_9PROT|nr:putative polysaccharide deacetylase [Magnetofaba australis IT-1]